MASGVTDLDSMMVFGGGADDAADDSEAAALAAAGPDARSRNNDYLGKIAALAPEEVNVFSMKRTFDNMGLDLSMPDTKLDWRDEVAETLTLVERFLVDATGTLRRIMDALAQYDEGKMTVVVTFASSTAERVIEAALREPAHALKGAAATVTFDRVALACRAIELPLKAAAEAAERGGMTDDERRAVVDGVLGPSRELVQKLWDELDAAVAFLHDELLAHLLEHRCGRRTLEEAAAYIPSADDLDAGAPMPEGEPDDYNGEDWADDIADIAEDLEEIRGRVPRDLVATSLAPFVRPGTA